MALTTIPALRRPTADGGAWTGGRGAATAGAAGTGDVGDAGEIGADGGGETAASGATVAGSLGTMRPSGRRRSGPIGGDAGGNPTPPCRGDSDVCEFAHGANINIAHASNADFIDIFCALVFFNTAVIISPYSDENTGFAAVRSRA